MDTNTAEQQPLDRRRREAHPEVIVCGDIEYHRNDLVARKFGMTERALNLRDRLGLPFQKFGNVKYRPQPATDSWIASGIQSHRPPETRRRRRR